MPIIKSAKKALRRDRRRTLVNNKLRRKVKEAMRDVKRSGKGTAVAAAYRVLDRAAKKGVIHKNKAARFKSRLAKKLKLKEHKTKKRRVIRKRKSIKA